MAGTIATADPHQRVDHQDVTDAEKIAYLEAHYNACWGCISAGAQRSCKHLAERGEADRMRIKPGAYLLTLTANAAAFPDRGDQSPSPIELSLLEAFWRAGFQPVQQCPIAGYIVDFAFPKARLAVEADGGDYHQDDEREHTRDEAIRRAGWHIVHFKGSTIWRDADTCVRSVYHLARSSLV